MVMVALLRAAHLGLEAEHLGPVLAERTVHRGVAAQHIQHPLLKGGEHLGMITEIAGMEQLDAAVLLGHTPAVLHDPAHQHPGEEKVGEDHDPAVAELQHLPQPGFHQREGDARVQRFPPAEAEALHEQPGHLGHVAVRIRIGGAAAHHHQQGVVAGHGRAAGDPGGRIGGIETRLHPGPGRLDHAAIHPEFAAVIDAKTGLGGVGVEHRRDVVLDMPGGEQHCRDGQHMAYSALAQGLKSLAQDRPGEFQIAGFHRHRGKPPAQLLHQLREFLHRQPVAAAMAADQHADRPVGTLQGQPARRLRGLGAAGRSGSGDRWGALGGEGCGEGCGGRDRGCAGWGGHGLLRQS